MWDDNDDDDDDDDERLYDWKQHVGSYGTASDLVFELCHVLISLRTPAALCLNVVLNLLATDFFFQILAHPVFKMWVIQKPNKVALWNERHFEERKMEIIQHV